MSKGRALRGSAVRLTLTVLPTVAFICAVMFFIAIKAEQNTLYGFSIEKKEYIRVLNNIINEEASIDDSIAEYPGSGGRRTELLRQRGLRGKKDSFVQLAANMERQPRGQRDESRRNGQLDPAHNLKTLLSFKLKFFFKSQNTFSMNN